VETAFVLHEVNQK